MTKRELVKILNLTKAEEQAYPHALKTLEESFKLSGEVHEPTVHLIWDAIPFRTIKKLEDKLNRIRDFTI